MQTEKNLKAELQTVHEVKNMLTSLQELYVNRMQKVKDSILTSREYYQGVFSILAEVLHEREIQFTQSSKQKVKQSTLVILFSGSKKFAGSVNREVFNSFKKYIQTNICDIIVLGKIGRDLLIQHDIQNTYTHYEWAEDGKSTEIIQTIARCITKYSSVKLFFAQYVNLTSQKTLEVNLYEGLQRDIVKNLTPKSEYIFEPDKLKVTNFFETRVLEAYLFHTLQELYLALMGSRVYRMEESSTNAKKLIKVLEHLNMVTHKTGKNRDQLSNITRIMNIKRSNLA